MIAGEMAAEGQTGKGNSMMVPVTGVGWQRGLANLWNGEVTRWFRTRTWWVQILIWASCTNLIYFFAAFSTRNEPSFEGIVIFFIMLALAGPIGACIIMQMEVVGETRAGTAAWILSKPVSRQSFILSKLFGNMLGLGVTMILAQGVIAYLITGLVLDSWLPPVGFAAAMGVCFVNVLFYMTLTLMCGTIFDHPAPVIGIPMAVLFVQNFIGNSAPKLAQYLPWSLVVPLGAGRSPAMALATGEPVGSLTTLYTTLLLSLLWVVIALVVFRRQEL
jgi:ABC-2 type transport system permease protein